ncbi:MAG: MMPL family transporter [Solirubrobacterales bacterium]
MRSLGRFAYRRRRALALVGLLLAVGSALGGASVFDNVKPFGFQDPGSQSSRAYDALENSSGEQAIPAVELVCRGGKQGVESIVAAAVTRLSTVDGITRVLSPFSPRSQPELLSDDRQRALVVGFVSADVSDTSEVGASVRRAFAGFHHVTVGGTAVTVDELTKTTQDDLRRIELYALPILLLLSLLVFRGLVAAVLPIVVGALSILTSLLLLNVLTTVMDIDTFAINIVTGLGLGLAIDYSLFLVTRFREELGRTRATQIAEPKSIEAAVAETTAAIGPMILISGITVALSLIALCVFPQRFLYSIGIGGALVALSSAIVCLLLLPALLALLGDRVNALAPRGFHGSPSNWRWHRLARFVLSYPVSVAIAAVAIMFAAGLPFLRVELTQANAKILPEDASAHRVEQVVATQFATDPADVIVLAYPTRRGAVVARRELSPDLTVADVQGPRRVGAHIYRLDAILRVDSDSDTAVQTVKRIRNSRWGTAALVGGPPAELTDERHSLGAHIPVAIAFILISTAILLFVMTASVLIPIIALVMNTLTVSVAFGVLVLIFQDGRLEGALNYASPGGLDTSMPILLFAVIFGLSTDYGIFLLQQIREARRQTDDEEVAIATGMARSGRTITAAAVLFAVAMGAFAFSDLVYVKEVAVGAAVAVLVDATIVRAFLFPAVLRLCGRRAWWAPSWLRRFARPSFS